MRRFLNLLGLSGVLWSGLVAQERNGTLTGLVTDSAHAILQGARVDLEPAAAPAVSNNQGEFTITGLAAGKYTLTISFVGLAPFSKEVTVTGGQVTRVVAELQVESLSESVTVSAERVHGEAEAINREFTAENILQVLPAEVITSLPNANVADAIGRLPSVTLERDEGEGKYVQIRGTEPRYSNVTIDGVNVASPETVRQIKLDIIPSDLVESVEINKTLQANQDGDAIGGSVNLRTKTAGDLPAMSLFGLGGYTPIVDGRTVSQFGGTASQRFGREKRLGLLFGGTYDWNGRGINDVEPGPTVIQCDPGNCGSPSANAANFGTYNTYDQRDYRYYRTRFGFAGSMDYRLGENASIWVRGLYSHFDNFGDRWVYTPNINSFTTSPFQGGPDGNMQANAQIRRPVQVIGSLAAGGRHSLNPTTVVTWEISAGRAATEDKGYSTANFAPIDPNSPLNNVQFGVNLSHPYRPRFDVQNGVNIYDPTGYFFQSIDSNRSYSPQVNLQGGVDVSKAYSWNGHYGTFEIGGKVRNTHKFAENDDRFYNVNDGVLVPISAFPIKTTDSNYYDKSYSEGAFPNYTNILGFFKNNPNDFTFLFDKTHQRNDPNNFNLTERVSAGYVMNAINFGKWRLYTGLRFEGTNLDVTGYLVTTDSKGHYVSTNPQKQNSGYTDPLPSVMLRYAITPESAIRIAYGRGIARPNFGDLPPYINLNDKRNTVSVGNPNLKPTHANNYDVLYEHYLKPLGLIQAGFFYKDITDPIYAVQSPLTTGTYAGFLQTQSVNGSSAYVYGFEAAYQQRLAFLPGVLSALGISANYSYTTSRANGVPGRSDHPALQRQAPHTWNISPTYDRGRVSLRVGVAYNAANIFFYNYSDGAPLGLKGPNGDDYLYAHLQIDAQASIRLAKGFSAIVYGLNLNNEVFGFYNGSPTWVVQREYYKPTYAAGLRWNSAPER